MVKDFFKMFVRLFGVSLIALWCAVMRFIKEDKKTGLTREKVHRIRYMDNFKKTFFGKHRKIKELLGIYGV